MPRRANFTTPTKPIRLAEGTSKQAIHFAQLLELGYEVRAIALLPTDSNDENLGNHIRVIYTLDEFRVIDDANELWRFESNNQHTTCSGCRGNHRSRIPFDLKAANSIESAEIKEVEAVELEASQSLVSPITEVDAVEPLAFVEKFNETIDLDKPRVISVKAEDEVEAIADSDWQSQLIVIEIEDEDAPEPLQNYPTLETEAVILPPTELTTAQRDLLLQVAAEFTKGSPVADDAQLPQSKLAIAQGQCPTYSAEEIALVPVLDKPAAVTCERETLITEAIINPAVEIQPHIMDSKEAEIGICPAKPESPLMPLGGLVSTPVIALEPSKPVTIEIKDDDECWEFTTKVFQAWRQLSGEVWGQPVSIEALYDNHFRSILALVFLSELAGVEGFELSWGRLVLLNNPNYGELYSIGTRKCSAVTFTKLISRKPTTGHRALTTPNTVLQTHTVPQTHDPEPDLQPAATNGEDYIQKLRKISNERRQQILDAQKVETEITSAHEEVPPQSQKGWGDLLRSMFR